MNALQVVQQIGNLEALYCTLVGVTSVVVHAKVVPPWWRSGLATHLMAYMAAIAAVFVLTSVRILAGTSIETPWFAALRVVVFTGIPVVMTWRLAIQLRSQRRRADDGSVHGLAEALADVGFQAATVSLDADQARLVAATLREALPRPVLAALLADEA